MLRMLNKFIRRFRRKLFRAAAKYGTIRYCNCCGKRSGRFLSKGDYDYNRRDHVECPWCGSLERHRLLLYHLKETMGCLETPLKVLHFAAEPCLANVFHTLDHWDYLTADLYAPAMVKEDITSLSFSSDAFDLIICSHVLDHIPEDRKAMAELARVLKPGGFLLAMSLVDFRSPTTLEGPQMRLPQRSKGHEVIRVYGKDYKERLESCGFDVEVIDYAESFSTELKRKYAVEPQKNEKLLNQTAIFQCRRK